MNEWYNIFVEIVQKEMPIFAPAILMNVERLKTEKGIDLQKDFFDLFSNELIQIDLSQEEITLDNSNRVILCGIKDSEKFEESFLGMMSMIPTMKLESVNYMGAKVYPLKEGTDEKSQPAIAFYKNYFIYSPSLDSINNIIRHIKKTPKKALVNSKLTKPFQDDMPSKVQGVGFNNLTIVIKNLLNLIHSNKGVLGNAFRSSPVKIKLSDLPKSEEIEDDLGVIFGYSIRNNLSIRSIVETKHP